MLTRKQVSYLLLLLALGALPFADIEVYTLNPWQELGRLALGAITPGFYDFKLLLDALLSTVSFALLGVAIGSVSGMMLALIYAHPVIKAGCAFFRAIHELFWALIFLQIFGLHPLTGLLAIALPYAATFAKVYAEIMEETDPAPLRTIPPGSGRLSRFIYAQVAPAWAHLKSYTAYRTECALRSSAILGFIGLPTLGYYLQSAFLQGEYSQVSALLLIFYLLVATIPWWLKKRFIPFYLLAGGILLGQQSVRFSWHNAVRFFTQDIVPYPLRHDGTAQELWRWFEQLFQQQAIPGLVETLVLAQIALFCTGVLALLLFPLVSTHFSSTRTRFLGNLLLIMLRSTPEYILAFVLLQLWGPSMLPAIIALMLHNSSILAHLMGRYSNEIKCRIDASHGLNRYAYEVVPRIYGQFLSFLLYRWEIIMRETAILGMLGITTLGFYVDNAMQDLRFDRAMVLIICTALLNISVNAVSSWLRVRSSMPVTAQQRCTA